MDDLQLLIGGTLYAGWKEISVRRSLDEAADSFDLTLTDRWSEAMARRPLRLGEPCQVLIGGEKLITGYVDRITPRYDARSRSLTVSGRSKVADLVDCSLSPEVAEDMQKNGQTLLQVAKRLCKPFGISVSSTVNGLGPFRQVNTNPGQTVFEILETYSRMAAVMLVSDPSGDIVITRASTKRLSTALKLGENIREASGEFSQRDRFSHYYFVGQQPGNDTNHGEASAHVKGLAADLAVHFRPTMISAETPMNLGEAKLRAEWQRNVSYGRSRQVTYTVSGWVHADGLWEPNRLVQVFDEWMGFDGEWLMIGAVEFAMDSSGQRTQLTVMPPQAYDLIPIPASSEESTAW